MFKLIHHNMCFKLNNVIVIFNRILNKFREGKPYPALSRTFYIYPHIYLLWCSLFLSVDSSYHLVSSSFSIKDISFSFSCKVDLCLNKSESSFVWVCFPVAFTLEGQFCWKWNYILVFLFQHLVKHYFLFTTVSDGMRSFLLLL